MLNLPQALQHLVSERDNDEWKPYILPGYEVVAEPVLLFDKNKEISILRGLTQFGPFSKSQDYLAEIKIATITPSGETEKIKNIIYELSQNKPTALGKTITLIIRALKTCLALILCFRKMHLAMKYHQK